MLVVAVVGYLLVIGSPGADDTTAGGQPESVSTTRVPSTTSEATGTVIGTDGGTYISPSTGVRIDVPRGAFTKPTRIDISATTMPELVDVSLESAGPLVDIDVDGDVGKPLSITFPISTPTAPELVEIESDVSVPATSSFVVTHYVDGAWIAQAATLDDAARTLTIQTSTFSPFGVFRIGARFIIDLIKSTFEELTSGLAVFVPEPDCGDGTDDAANWTSNPASGPVSWCAAMNDDGSRVVQVANRKRYGITVSVDPTSTIKNDGTDLASSLSQLLSPPRQVALAPGETSTITVPADAAGTEIASSYDGVAQSLTSLLVATDILAELTAHVPGVTKKSATEFRQVLRLQSCVTGLGINISGMTANPASTIVRLLTKCLTGVLPKAVAFFIGGALATVAGTIAYFISSGQAVFDLLIGGSESTLQLTATTVNGSTPSTTAPIAASVWPVGDNEGTLAFFAYLGASLIGFEWSSCSTNYCIVGSSDTLYLFGTRPKYDGITDLGTMPLSTPEPRGAFIEAGLEPDEVDALLRTGAP